MESAVRIMRFLGHSQGPQSVTQIARHLDINTSTCFNILRTLAAEGVVAFDGLSKTYTAGIGMTALVEGTFRGGIDIQAVQPKMGRFAREHEVTVTLWRRLGDRMVLAAIAESSSDYFIRMRLGQRIPMLLGATGRCMAAFGGLEENEFRPRFDEVQWARPISFEMFMRQVREAGRRGWSRDDRYYSTSIIGLSAPVAAAGRPAAATCGATLFTGQHDTRTIAAIGQALRCLAADLANHVRAD